MDRESHMNEVCQHLMPLLEEPLVHFRDFVVGKSSRPAGSRDQEPFGAEPPEELRSDGRRFCIAQRVRYLDIQPFRLATVEDERSPSANDGSVLPDYIVGNPASPVRTLKQHVIILCEYFPAIIVGVRVKGGKHLPPFTEVAGRRGD